ncbi:MAG: hypothetical protein ACEPOZ_17640 [Marinifilaceae bacterium]
MDWIKCFRQYKCNTRYNNGIPPALVVVNIAVCFSHSQGGCNIVAQENVGIQRCRSRQIKTFVTLAPHGVGRYLWVLVNYMIVGMQHPLGLIINNVLLCYNNGMPPALVVINIEVCFSHPQGGCNIVA